MYIPPIALNFDSGPLVVNFGAHNITELNQIQYTGNLLKQTGCIGYITTKNVCLPQMFQLYLKYFVKLSCVYLIRLEVCSPGVFIPLKDKRVFSWVLIFKNSTQGGGGENPEAWGRIPSSVACGLALA